MVGGRYDVLVCDEHLLSLFLTVSTEYQGIVAHLWGSGVFWFTILLLPVFCMSRDFAWKSYKRFARPEPYHIVQEIQKYVVTDFWKDTL